MKRSIDVAEIKQLLVPTVPTGELGKRFDLTICELAAALPAPLESPGENG
jgi:hypothetical protein